MAVSIWPIRKHLLVLVTAVGLPLAIFSGAMLYVSLQEQKDATARNMGEIARALAAGMDREFMGTIQALKILALSKTLNEGRLAEFYDEMKNARAAYGPAWHNIVLSDRTGLQLINLRRPFGSPLPRVDPELIEENLRTGQPSISNVFSGTLTNVPSIVVSVPAFEDGQIRYLLRAGYSPARLSEILLQQKLPPDWLATIIDRNHVIAARNRDIERYLGKPASASFANQARQFHEAHWRGATLDGIEVVSSLHHSDLSGWAVGIAVPVELLEVPLRHSLTILVVGGLLLLLTGAAFALLTGRRITKTYELLADAAATAGRGEMPKLAPLPIAEANDLARIFEEATTKRNEAEAALRESEDRYRDLVEHSQDLICTHNMEGRILSVNPSAAKTLGYESHEMLRMNLRDVLAPHVRHEFDDYLATIRANGAANGLMLMQTRTGEKRIWEYANTLRTEGVPTPTVRGMAHDITERMRVETALRASEERLRLAVSGADLGTWHWNIRNGELIWSDRCLAMFGIPPGTVMSYEKFLAALHPEDRARADAAVQRALQERTGYNIEFRSLWPDGSVHWAASKGHAYYDYAGRPLRMEGVALDITERKWAEETQALLAAVVNSSSDGIVSRALDRTITSWNVAAERMFGYTAAEVIGSDLMVTVPPELRQEAAELRKRVAAGALALTFETVRIAKDGRRVDVALTVFPIKDNDGRVVGTASILRDITERKKMEVALRESEERHRSISQLTSDYIFVFRVGTDGNPVLETMSDAFVRIVGYTIDEFRALPTAFEFIHPDDRPIVAETIARNLAGESNVHEVRIFTKQGAVRWVRTYVHPMWDASHRRVVTLYGASQDITERKLAETALRESEERYRTLVEQAADAIFVAGLDGRFREANSRACEMFGYTRNEFVGLHTVEVVAEHEAERQAQAFLRVLDGEGLMEERQFRRKDGTLFSGEIFAGQTNAGLVIGIVRDITERKRAEEAQATLAAIVENSNDAIIGRALDGTIISWNAAAERILGYRAAEVIGSDPVAIFPPDQSQQAMANRELVKAGKSVPIRDTVRIAKDGRRVNVAISMSAIKDRNGFITGTATVLRDITERKQAEVALERQRRDYQTIIDAAPVMIAYKSKDDHFVRVNSAFAEFLGLPVEKILGMTTFDLVLQPEVARQGRAHDLEVIRTGKPVINQLIKWSGIRSNKEIWALYSKLPFRDPDGTIIGTVSFVIDVNDRVLAEQKVTDYAERLQVLSRRLIETQETERGNIARELHDEIGQVLSVAMLNLNALQRGLEANPLKLKLDQAIEMVNNTLQQVRTLSLNLRPPQLDDLGLAAALHALIDRSKASTSLQIHFTVADLPTLSAPLDIVCYRIIQEALTNVIRHADAKNLWIELRVESATLHVIVKDDGKGYDPEAAQERALRGYSMGVLDMEERARLSGGRMRVETKPGAGTTIYAELPLSPPPPRIRPKEPLKNVFPAEAGIQEGDDFTGLRFPPE